MTPRRLCLLAALCAALAALSIAFFDVALARAIAAAPEGVERFFHAGTQTLDFISGKEHTDTLLPLACLALGLLLWRRPSARPLARLLVLVALTNLTAHLTVGVLKPLCGRLRPLQIEPQGWHDRFFAGGASFPSGHTAYYFGLALPLAWALPRWRLVALAPAAFVALARVMVDDHFAGDVLGSLSVTLLVAAGWIALFERWLRLAPR